MTSPVRDLSTVTTNRPPSRRPVRPAGPSRRAAGLVAGDDARPPQPLPDPVRDDGCNSDRASSGPAQRQPVNSRPILAVAEQPNDSAEARQWRKSTYGDGGCIGVDDAHPGGPVLRFTPAAWARFVSATVAGEFGIGWVTASGARPSGPRGTPLVLRCSLSGEIGAPVGSRGRPFWYGRMTA
ncbi:uncharacterized protein DUF397 [Kitasatospora cineracea]|uniref:Uncharacterized protein DUF397 n=1 Tax=Kitasatospora cineracea TaxID=88074 RepID=A0A8G1XGF9_9ACTN|nr:uncharacterized protein DUF397 [Kitasatospora cineracea]